MSAIKAIVAMKLLVEWRKLREFCKEKESCLNCPYFHKKSCDMISTDAMIDRTANAFQEYLEEIDA